MRVYDLVTLDDLAAWQNTVPLNNFHTAVAEAKSEREAARTRANDAREIRAQLDSATAELQSTRSEVVRLQNVLAGAELAREAVVSRALTAESAAARARDETLQLNSHLCEARREAIRLQVMTEVIMLNTTFTAQHAKVTVVFFESN